MGHAAAFLLALPLTLRYRLDRTRHQRIIQDLAARRLVVSA